MTIVLPYSWNSTLHPRLWSAVASHRFSFCLAPPPSSPNLCARTLPQSPRPDLIGKIPILSGLGRGELCAKSGLSLRYSRNSFALYSFADPHTLNLYTTIPYKKVGGRALSTFALRSRFKSFSCNIYGHPRNCCKQRTYSKTKPFKCNIYKKHRGGVSGRYAGFPYFFTPLRPYFVLLSDRATCLPCRGASLYSAAAPPSPFHRWRQNSRRQSPSRHRAKVFRSVCRTWRKSSARRLSRICIRPLPRTILPARIPDVLRRPTLHRVSPRSLCATYPAAQFPSH